MRKHTLVKRIFVVKGIVAVGLISVYIIPPQYAPGVSVMANFLWLFWEEKEIKDESSSS